MLHKLNNLKRSYVQSKKNSNTYIYRTGQDQLSKQNEQRLAKQAEERRASGKVSMKDQLAELKKELEILKQTKSKEMSAKDMQIDNRNVNIQEDKSVETEENEKVDETEVDETELAKQDTEPWRLVLRTSKRLNQSSIEKKTIDQPKSSLSKRRRTRK